MAIVEEYGIVNGRNLKQSTPNFSGIILNKEYKDKLDKVFIEGGPAGHINYVIYTSPVSYVIKIQRFSQKDSFYCYDSSDKELNGVDGKSDRYKIIYIDTNNNIDLKTDCKSGEILKGSEGEGF